MKSRAISPYHQIAISGVMVLYGSFVHAESPFATRVVEYSPAPGQFVNDPFFNDPAQALGPPSGGGTSAPNNESIVTLGGFGGYIVLVFDHTVFDDLLNPLGLDAIVFSNAYWVGGNPDRHWAECATIEISRDDNGNDLADDFWYLIPGSHLAAPLTRSAHSWSNGTTTYAYPLPVEPFGAMVVVNPVAGSGNEGIYGYAEYSPTLFLGDMDGDDEVDDQEIVPENFYTVPDDPFEAGMTLGCGGGDAFDIAWAVDPLTGEPANLQGFDFIRITTPIHVVMPAVGEKSAEIDAVADVAPDSFGDVDSDGDIDLQDAASLQICIGLSHGALQECQLMALSGEEFVGLREAGRLIIRMTGPI
jgi:hypothetical protein